MDSIFYSSDLTSV